MSKRPTVVFIFSRWYALVACGFGAGLGYPFAGTVGSFLAWLLLCPIQLYLSSLWFGLAWVFAFFFGVLCCERTGKALSHPDHNSIVWDEMVAVWLVLAVLSPISLGQSVLAVCVFRVFDVLKPFPVSWFDQKWKNGWGVMLDDWAAAVYTIVVIWGGGRILQLF